MSTALVPSVFWEMQVSIAQNDKVVIEMRHCYTCTWRSTMSRSRFMLFSLALFVIGLFVVLQSVAWGSAAANAYLRAQGGGMDGSQFMIVLQGYINIYLWIGSILAFISGLGFVKAMEVK